MSSGLFCARLVRKMNESCLSGVACVSQEAAPCKSWFLRECDFEKHMSQARKELYVQVSLQMKGKG